MVQEIEETLKLLGLTPIQAQVYLTLIKTGRSSAKTLSKNSNVACPDIYRIMDIFEKIGLVQKVIEYPKKYEAVKIEQGLPRLLDRKKEETAELEKKMEDFIEIMKHEQSVTGAMETNSDLILFPPNKMVFQIRRERITNAQKSIDAVISVKSHNSYLDMNLEELTKKAVKRGVKYRFIIETPKNKDLLAECATLNFLAKNGAQIRNIEKPPSAIFAIYDNKEALICTSNEAKICDTPLLWTNNCSITAIITGYFEYLWAKTEANTC